MESCAWLRAKPLAKLNGPLCQTDPFPCVSYLRIFKIAPDKTATVLVDDWEAHTLSNPTNVAFGGPENDQLYVSNLGRWHILKIEYGQKGMPLASHKRS